MGTAALDIETISPDLAEDEDPDFLNSRDFELLAVGVGYRPTKTSDPEMDVLWRTGVDVGDEYRLLARVAEWLSDRAVEEIVTYNGSSFDERHLRGRAQLVADEVGDPTLPEVLHAQLQVLHRDLIHDVTRIKGHRTSLEDAVEEFTGNRPQEVEWQGERVTNRDIPRLGQEWLVHRSGLTQLDYAEELKATLKEYVAEDIRPLFDLADALDERTTVR